MSRVLPVLLIALFLASPAFAQEAITVWYLGHCGYAVQTENHFLIFDYIELEESPTERGLERGFVDPQEIADRDVTVFVTHPHVDHYDEGILAWAETIPEIHYVFGWEVEEGPRHHAMAEARASLTLGDLVVDTVPSHHSGVPEVAYLVRVDGWNLVHAGDYQGRPARGAPSHAVEDMRYFRSKAPRIDLLFLGAWTGEPYLDILRGLEPTRILPMHDRHREEHYLVFAEELRELGFEQPVPCPTKRGDRFSFAPDDDR